jgi:hypothetical protein
VGIKETLTANAAPFLEPGEVVDEAFRAGKRVGQSTAVRVFVIVGTQESVLVLRPGMLSTKKPKAVVKRFPRSTPMTFEKGRLTIGADWFDVAPLGGAREEAARLVAASAGGVGGGDAAPPAEA